MSETATPPEPVPAPSGVPAPPPELDPRQPGVNQGDPGDEDGAPEE